MPVMLINMGWFKFASLGVCPIYCLASINHGNLLVMDFKFYCNQGDIIDLINSKDRVDAVIDFTKWYDCRTLKK